VSGDTRRSVLDDLWSGGLYVGVGCCVCARCFAFFDVLLASAEEI